MVAVLVVLHAPDGHEILLNPEAIASMHAGVEGKPNELVTNKVRCVINTWDGKFVSVAESCDEVRRLIDQGRAK